MCFSSLDVVYGTKELFDRWTRHGPMMIAGAEHARFGHMRSNVHRDCEG